MVNKKYKTSMIIARAVGLIIKTEIEVSNKNIKY